jgi:hypothetical protein
MVCVCVYIYIYICHIFFFGVIQGIGPRIF